MAPLLPFPCSPTWKAFLSLPRTLIDRVLQTSLHVRLDPEICAGEKSAQQKQEAEQVNAPPPRRSSSASLFYTPVLPASSASAALLALLLLQNSGETIES
jgi:hypothetical protein